MESKNINFSNIEILSPAGSSESFFAALNNGADAIYLGLSDFNARMKAQNFTTSNIRDYIKQAHLFGVKIYVTVNTLLEDEDFQDLYEMIKCLVEAKTDAFIVQDLGVAYVLKNCFKDIVLHASTQMGIHNLEGALVAKKLGMKRIVLSRETKLQDIIEIKNNTDLEIEYFVQGALCVAFSGNCYLSAIEKNQSGNSGKCLQLCRLPYSSNKSSKKEYLLSARDLALLENLDKLIEAGVTSFKIEGRLRHPGYVATATSIYKNAINLLKIKSSLPDEFLNKSLTDLKTTFSRGDFNSLAYLEPGVPSLIINKDYQNHIGTKIGTVNKCTPFKNDLYKIEIKSNTEIHFGDGLKFIDEKSKKQIASIGAGNVENCKNGTYNIISKTKIYPNLSVFLTQNAENELKLLKNTQKIKINIKIIANSNKKLEILISNEKITTKYVSDYVLEKAKNQPLSEKDLSQQLTKLNDTVFEADKTEVETDGIFLPKSLLNKSRREAIALFEQNLLEFNEQHITAKAETNLKKIAKNIKLNPKNIVIFNNLNQIDKVEESIIYIYSPDYFSIENILTAQNKLKNSFALSLPTILNFEDKKLLNEVLRQLPKQTKLFANNISHLFFKDMGFEIIVSPLLNIKNSFAINALNELEIYTICSSIELKNQDSKFNKLVYFDSGNFPVMTFAHCPYKTIFNNNCNACKFDGNLTLYSDFKTQYKIRRVKLKNCQFQLLKNINLQNATFTLKSLIV